MGLPSRASPAITLAQPASRCALSSGSSSTKERALAWITAVKVPLERSARTPSSTPLNGNASSSTLPIGSGGLTGISPPRKRVPASAAPERQWSRPRILRLRKVATTGTHSFSVLPPKGTKLASPPQDRNSAPRARPAPLRRVSTRRMVSSTVEPRTRSWPGRGARAVRSGSGCRCSYASAPDPSGDGVRSGSLSGRGTPLPAGPEPPPPEEPDDEPLGSVGGPVIGTGLEGPAFLAAGAGPTSGVIAANPEVARPRAAETAEVAALAAAAGAAAQPAAPAAAVALPLRQRDQPQQGDRGEGRHQQQGAAGQHALELVGQAAAGQPGRRHVDDRHDEDLGEDDRDQELDQPPAPAPRRRPHHR